MDIVCDRGPQFVSLLWKAFCLALGVTVSLSSGFHPQTNGQAKRGNEDLDSALVTNPSTWSAHLAWINYVHHTLSIITTGMSLFEASLGYLPPLFPSEERDLALPSVQHYLQYCRKV